MSWKFDLNLNNNELSLLKECDQPLGLINADIIDDVFLNKKNKKIN